MLRKPIYSSIEMRPGQEKAIFQLDESSIFQEDFFSAIRKFITKICKTAGKVIGHSPRLLSERDRFWPAQVISSGGV